MFAALPRMQATRLLTLFGVGSLLILCSLLYSSLLSPSIYDLSTQTSFDTPSAYNAYYSAPLNAAKSAASRFFHSAPRVTLFTWTGGNKNYELEPLEEYADLASPYPVGAKPWVPEGVEGGAPREWTIPEEDRVRPDGGKKEVGKDWDFPAPQVDLVEQVVQEYMPPTVEFALVIMGERAAVEAATMIKGILMHISTPVQLHIVCDEPAMYYLDERLTIITRPAYDISISYNLLTAGQIWARAARAGIGSTYHAGAGGLVKVFLHEILTETKRAIFIDIDTLFTVDPLLLWKEFDKFRPGQVFALPTLGPGSDELTVCSCALLLDLEAMREHYQWVASDLRPQASRTDVAYTSLMNAGLDPRNPPFGDQGVYYAIWKTRPELAGHLSLSWDVSHCRNHWGFSMADGSDEMTEEEQMRRREERMRTVEGRMRNAPEKFPIFPGILHFNCIDNSANSFTYSDIVDWPDWGPLVQSATKYKWTWLNRGDGTSKVERVMYEDVRFADERWPESEHVGGWVPPVPQVQPEPVGMPVYEGEGGGEWEFVTAEQGQVEAFEEDMGAVQDVPLQEEGGYYQEQPAEWVQGEDGEWYQVAAAPVVEEWQPAEPVYEAPAPAYDAPAAYEEQPEYTQPEVPAQGDWMDELPSAPAMPQADELRPPQPEEPTPQEKQAEEEGKWIMGPYGEWIWVAKPAAPAPVVNAPPRPAEPVDAWSQPAAPAMGHAMPPPAAIPIPTQPLTPPPTDAELEREKLKEMLAAALAPSMPQPVHPAPAMPAPPTGPASQPSTDEDLERQKLKQMLAAALAKLNEPAPVSAPGVVAPPVESEELPPLRMARPDQPAPVESESVYEEFSPLPVEDLAPEPVTETAEKPAGEWVQEANGEWSWVAFR